MQGRKPEEEPVCTVTIKTGFGSADLLSGRKHCLCKPSELSLDCRTVKMAQWLRALAAKSDGMSSAPGSGMVEGENCLLRVAL